MIHFLLIYDHQSEMLLDQRVFTDAEEAAEAYSDAERNAFGREQLEIVLVGSDSIETVHRTHGHYFGRVPAASKYLAGV